MADYWLPRHRRSRPIARRNMVPRAPKRRIPRSKVVLLAVMPATVLVTGASCGAAGGLFKACSHEHVSIPQEHSVPVPREDPAVPRLPRVYNSDTTTNQPEP
jgi:hypothetical protein